jgi:uncharacterized protein YdeI (YjbR/CyaY-like superfamily)
MPKVSLNDFEKVYAKDRATFRRWLEQNHATKSGIWLVYYKKRSGKPSISYPEAVKEALCFGWIDSKVNAIDDERYMQVFTPRKAKSVWSALNKKYIAELQGQNLVTAAGLKTIDSGKASIKWRLSSFLRIWQNVLGRTKSPKRTLKNYHHPPEKIFCSG